MKNKDLIKNYYDQLAELQKQYWFEGMETKEYCVRYDAINKRIADWKMSDSKKLRKLKEIRRKNLEKNLLDVQLKGQDHYVFINDRNKAQVVSKDGAWVTEHIRTSILKYNFEIDKIEKMLVKDFTKEELKEYERSVSKDS